MSNADADMRSVRDMTSCAWMDLNEAPSVETQCCKCAASQGWTVVACPSGKRTQLHVDALELLGSDQNSNECIWHCQWQAMRASRARNEVQSLRWRFQLFRGGSTGPMPRQFAGNAVATGDTRASRDPALTSSVPAGPSSILQIQDASSRLQTCSRERWYSAQRTCVLLGDHAILSILSAHENIWTTARLSESRITHRESTLVAR